MMYNALPTGGMYTPHIGRTSGVSVTEERPVPCPGCKGYTDQATLDRRGSCTPCHGNVVDKGLPVVMPEPLRVRCPVCERKATSKLHACEKCKAKMDEREPARTGADSVAQLAESGDLSAFDIARMTGCSEYYAARILAQNVDIVKEMLAAKVGSTGHMRRFSDDDLDDAWRALFGPLPTMGRAWMRRAIARKLKRMR